MYFYSGVSNYRETPYIISDDYANIGNYAATIKGSVYIARDGASLSVPSIYQANGTSWVAIGSSVTAAASSLQAVTTVGNTSNQGIVVTANGISTNSLTNTGLTEKSIPFVGTGGLISQDNTNFVWDNTNKWLGIQTNTPTAELDLHSTTTTPMIALNNTAGNASNILFQNTNVSKFRLGNNAANNFVLFNNTLASTAFFVTGANNNFLLGSTTDDTVSKLQVTGKSAFTANVTAGSSFNFTTNQTNTNVTDTGDGSVVINNALTGTGTTNEEVLRALTIGNSNKRTGGSILVNSRAISTISSTLASTTTTNLDQIYLDYDTAAGTVTNGRGVTIKRMYGTSQAAFVTSTLTSTNRSHLFIGGYTLPSGAWGIYSSITDSSSFLGRMIVGTNTDDTVNQLQVTGTAKISLDANIHSITVGQGGNGSTISNTAVGYQALNSFTFAVGNSTAIGYQALLNLNKDTSANTSIGYQAGLNANSNYNTLIGSNAGTLLSTNGSCTFVGYQAGNNNTGASNTGVGDRALNGVSGSSNGLGNTAVGTQSLAKLTTGQLNSAFSGNSGLNITSGSNNFLAGLYAGGSITSGGSNLIISVGNTSSSLLPITTGSYNTIIGKADNTSGIGTTSSNLVVIADGQGNQRLVSFSSGNIFIGAGTTLPTEETSAKLQISSTTQGFLPPKMTTGQKNAIATPAIGLFLYDTTLNKLCVYTGATWETVTSL